MKSISVNRTGGGIFYYRHRSVIRREGPLLLILILLISREGYSGQSWRSFLSDSVEAIRIEPQCFKNCGSHLHSFDKTSHGALREPRVRQQHHHVRVVMGESTELRLFLAASRIDHTHVRLHDNIRCSWVERSRQARRVEHSDPAMAIQR